VTPPRPEFAFLAARWRKLDDTSRHREIRKAVACVALAATLMTLANQVSALETPDPRQLIDSPRSFLERTIQVRNVACVDRPRDGFLCIGTFGGKALRIESSALGAQTTGAIAGRLIGPCKGLENLEKPACRFDVEVTPRSVQSEQVMLEFEGIRATRIYSGAIEMREARRSPRSQ